MKTIFQRIIDRVIPGTFKHEDDLCVAIRDIEPRAPDHLIIFPTRLIPRLSESEAGDQQLLGHLLGVARTVAKKLNLKDGFRLVINNGPYGGESVPHLHIHLLAGRPLSWPPG